MKTAKMITALVLTLSAATSFANTNCDHKDLSNIFANTNPPAAVKTVQTSSSTQAATR